ncbi:MAG: SAM-dependent methyltransferase [Clostridia bacterium]|nr:SAM-dependent methyltransferase [Clostridia bacterium]
MDERLHAAAELFTACDVGADIGADHGRLSCYLLHQRICRNMIVSDISAESLSKAQRLLSLHGLSGQAHFRVADGLDALKDTPVQCIAICGMGGRLMSDILIKGRQMLCGADLVLSCHTEIPLIRESICAIGYHLIHEKLVRAKGRYYVIMKATEGKGQYEDKELYLGPILMQERPPLWKPFLQWRDGVVSCEKNHKTQLQWIREELEKCSS